jgi:hypothetical protein
MARTFKTERRASPRYPAVPNSLCVECPEDTVPLRFAACLLDVSRAGAAMGASCLPPRDRTIWIRLHDPVRSDWVKATVVWHDKVERVGIRLQHPCPFFFDAAWLGIDFRALFHPGGAEGGGSTSGDEITVFRPPDRH